jgi:urease accessory protein
MAGAGFRFRSSPVSEITPGPVFSHEAPFPGRGTVRVEDRGGRSVVTCAYATSPLRLLTPRNHGRGGWIYTSSYGGGLVDGDQIALDVEVGSGACAWVSTQASTKVYRSRFGSGTTFTARVDEGGVLVAAPDPVVCFAASRYRQSQRIELAPTASLVLVDWVTSGRRASGERWLFHEYISRLDVSVDAKRVVYESLALRADEGNLAERMGRFDVLAIVLVVGGPLLERASAIVAGVADEPIARKANRLVAATMLAPRELGEIGCLVRIAAGSVEDAGRTIRSCLRFVPDLLGDDPWARKW